MNKVIIEGVVQENILEGVDIAHVTDENNDLDEVLLSNKGKKVRVTIEVLE